MKRKHILIIALTLLLTSTITSLCFARVRVVLRPWWPRAIVIAPPVVVSPLPRSVPPAYRAPVVNPTKIGYVDLNVQPADAEVYVDDTYRGPANLFSCSSECLALYRGKHTLSLRKEGYKTTNFIIKVLPGEIMEIDARLQAAAGENVEPASDSAYRLELEKTGFLALEVIPEDAAIYIDDNFYGIATQFDQSEGSLVLRSGVHKLQVTKPGYETYTKDIDISDGVVEKVVVELKR